MNNLTVTLLKQRDFTAICGGGCATTQVEVMIDRNLSKQQQIETLLHELTEVYFPNLPHDKVDDFTAFLISGYEKLMQARGNH